MKEQREYPSARWAPPLLGEEFDKNISSGVGAGAHFMRYTPEDTG